MQSQVRIQQGMLRGFGESGIHKFFGVPYAMAPIGRLRWRPPLAPPGWDGVREATRFGPTCVQTVGAAFDLRVAEQSEDCLYLNVWTRTLDVDARLDRRVSSLMQDAWIAFARHGVPTSSDNRPWPLYEAGAPWVAWIENGISCRPFPITQLMMTVSSLRTNA
jgi:carboxylesterase type B